MGPASVLIHIWQHFDYDFNMSFTPEQIATGRTTYNYRDGVQPMEEMSGNSIFYKDETGVVFHTYSSFARGGEVMLAAYALLDMTPIGRNEGIRGNLTDWVKLHDRYSDDGMAGRWMERADECRSRSSAYRQPRS